MEVLALAPTKTGEPCYQAHRRRSTKGAQGANTGQEVGEAMASVGVRLTARLGAGGRCRGLTYSPGASFFLYAKALDTSRPIAKPTTMYIFASSQDASPRSLAVMAPHPAPAAASKTAVTLALCMSGLTTKVSVRLAAQLGTG